MREKVILGTIILFFLLSGCSNSSISSSITGQVVKEPASKELQFQSLRFFLEEESTSALTIYEDIYEISYPRKLSDSMVLHVKVPGNGSKIKERVYPNNTIMINNETNITLLRMIKREKINENNTVVRYMVIGQQESLIDILMLNDTQTITVEGKQYTIALEGVEQQPSVSAIMSIDNTKYAMPQGVPLFLDPETTIRVLQIMDQDPGGSTNFAELVFLYKKR